MPPSLINIVVISAANIKGRNTKHAGTLGTITHEEGDGRIHEVYFMNLFSRGNALTLINLHTGA